MNNTTRDRTKEGLDPDNPGVEVVPPPETPVPDDSAHIPGGATEMGELERGSNLRWAGRAVLKKHPETTREIAASFSGDPAGERRANATPLPGRR